MLLLDAVAVVPLSQPPEHGHQLGRVPEQGHGFVDCAGYVDGVISLEVTSLEDCAQDVEEEDLIGLGMKPPAVRRWKRLLEARSQ